MKYSEEKRNWRRRATLKNFDIEDTKMRGNRERKRVTHGG
jgi:hypothetical protein